MPDYNKVTLAQVVTITENRKNISETAMEVISIIKGMSEEDVGNLSIQKGLSILVHWLTLKLNNPKVSTSINSIQLLRTDNENLEEKETFSFIGGLRFRDNIRMIDWKNAESISISSGKPKLFSLYLIANCCTDGYVAGRNMFISSDINEHIMQGLSDFNKKQMANPNMCLDVLNSFEFLTVGSSKRLLVTDSFFLPKFR